MANTTLVAISGSSGLFGSAFLEKFSGQIQITKFIQLKALSTKDIYKEIKKLSTLGIQVFLHLGWPASSSRDNYRDSEENFDALRKTILLKEACYEAGITFVGLGTILDKISDAENHYQLTKYVCRKMFRNEIEDQSIAWVRPYYVFNSHSWPDFLHSDKYLPVRILNNSPRDFIHLDDVIDGLFLIVQNRILGEIDLGSGRLTKPSELCEALGKRFTIEEEDTERQTFPVAKPHPYLSRFWSPTKTQNILKDK